ncbi:ribosome biogenesis ATPase RIX7 [Phlyctochytrium arcticum]|nr:ribosome biogenesis ATPase RIX7 [Phlyctochytrium arcticum]
MPPEYKSRTLQGQLEDRIYDLLDKHEKQQPEIFQCPPDDNAMLAFLRANDVVLARKPERNVRQAIPAALKRYKSSRDEGSSEDSDSYPNDQLEETNLVEYKDTNAMNQSLMSLYVQKSSSDGPVYAQSSEKTVIQTTEKGPLASLLADKAGKVGKRRIKENGNDTRDPKRSKKSAGGEEPASWETPTTRLADVGGMDMSIGTILELIGLPLKHPELYAHLGIEAPKGILLHGPPGCGKTMLAHAIAGETGVPFLNISAPSIVSGMSGESEKKIREVFEQARDLAPCILFFDEIDAITPKRETAQREMERRIVAQLLTCMDDISLSKTDNKAVIIIGATNRPDSLDSALRRAGRFDREIAIGIPNEDARKKILEKLCEKMRIGGQVFFDALARQTPGYVGADLKALAAEAGRIAVKRIFSKLSVGLPDRELNANAMEISNSTMGGVNGLSSKMTSDAAHRQLVALLTAHSETFTEADLATLNVEHDDFLAAIKIVQPSAKREGFATVPDIEWADVGALGSVREELRMSIIEPVKHPEIFARMGISSAMGVLLYGPPGCGKTLLAKAVANDTHCNFISVKGPELLNKFVGESERAIRMVFARAQASAPCIIFFDELDALCPARSNDSESQSSSRLVNTLLTEMDGMQGRKQVYVIGATNRPDMIDPAMIRPGRLDKPLYVDLPTAPERLEIFKAITRKTPLAADLNLEEVAYHPKCEGFSGADLAALVREATMGAIREILPSAGGLEAVGAAETMSAGVGVTTNHFIRAFERVFPSVNKKDRRRYELLRVKFGAADVPSSSS